MSRRKALSPETLKVLAALAAQPLAWRHGYDLSKETGVRSGTLYPLLIRLADRGLLEAEWRPSAKAGRPPRHAYRLTAQGLSLARDNASPAADHSHHADPMGAKA